MSSDYHRPSWNEYFKQIAEITATRSNCDKLHVGCILVNNNRIIAQGYNGYIAGLQHEPIIKDNHNIATIHAEQNTITDCAKRGVSCNNCVAYITHYPCFNCMKLMVSCGICQINYINDYNNDTEVVNLSKLTNININKLN